MRRMVGWRNTRRMANNSASTSASNEPWSSISVTAYDVVARAVARGELPDTVDRAIAADLLAAPLYWRTICQR
jgi:hypothetical protein